VFELPGELGAETQTLFSTPPNRLSNYVQGVSYILYTYDLDHNFVRSPTVEKFNPQLIFHNSNTVINPVCQYSVYNNRRAVFFHAYAYCLHGKQAYIKC